MRFQDKLIVIALLSSLIMHGCSPTPRQPGSNFSSVDDQEIEREAYKVGPGDVIDISVYENPDLHTVMRVPPEGFIPMPLIGNIQVSGLTILEIDEKITAVLENYLYNPQVTVMIKEYRKRYFYVLGEVKKPGAYQFEEGITVLEAIAIAGGLTSKASPGRTTITRKTGEKQEKFKLRMDNFVKEGDVINIPRSFF